MFPTLTENGCNAVCFAYSLATQSLIGQRDGQPSSPRPRPHRRTPGPPVRARDQSYRQPATWHGARDQGNPVVLLPRQSAAPHVDCLPRCRARRPRLCQHRHSRRRGRGSAATHQGGPIHCDEGQRRTAWPPNQLQLCAGEMQKKDACANCSPRSDQGAAGLSSCAVKPASARRR